MIDRPLVQKLRVLRDGNTIDFDGVKLRMVDGKDSGENLQPGDTYYACRNSEHIFTVRFVDMNLWCVHPVEIGYPFDIGECVGVEIVED